MTAAIFGLKVLPTKVSRAEVESIIDRHPIHTEVANLRGWTSQNQSELTKIREEIVGLRTDVAALTATLRALIQKQQ